MYHGLRDIINLELGVVYSIEIFYQNFILISRKFSVLTISFITARCLRCKFDAS